MTGCFRLKTRANLLVEDTGYDVIETGRMEKLRTEPKRLKFRKE